MYMLSYAIIWLFLLASNNELHSIFTDPNYLSWLHANDTLATNYKSTISLQLHPQFTY